MKIKIISYIVFSCSLLPAGVLAALPSGIDCEIKDDTCGQSFDNPWLISTCQGFQNIDTMIVDGLGAKDGSSYDNRTYTGYVYDHYAITQDIACTGTFTPIGRIEPGFSAGTLYRAFAGKIDGRGNTVSNITLSHTSAIRSAGNGSDHPRLGIFHYGRGATIQNIKFVNINTYATGWSSGIGTLFGRASGTIDLKNVYINATIDAPDSTYIGTIYGDGWGIVTIDRVGMDINLYGRTVIGGLMGWTGNTIVMKDSYVRGSVRTRSSIDSSSESGPLRGGGNGGTHTMENSYIDVDLIDQDDRVGHEVSSAINSFAVGYGNMTTTGTVNSYGLNQSFCNTSLPGCNSVSSISHFYDPSNEPMASWDFVNIWTGSVGAYPSLRFENLYSDLPPTNPPTLDTLSIYPSNGSGDVLRETNISIDVTEPDRDTVTNTLRIYDGSSPSCTSSLPSGHLQEEVVVGTGSLVFDLASDLAYETTFYWCVESDDGQGGTDYAGPFSFTTLDDPNTDPTISNVIPVDEATDEAIDSAVEIDYDDLDVADQVSVELNMYHGAEVTNCDSPGAASSVAFDEGSPQTNNDNSGSVVFSPSIDLTNSTTYYICTRASDDKGGVSSWILTSFTTKEANVPPTLGSFPTPADGALDQDASLSLEIDYSDSNSFDTVNLTARVYSGEPDCSAGLAVGHDQQLTYDVDSNSGTASFPVAGLPEGRTYYWCVEASDGIESSYRGPFSFSTATSGPAPGSIESVMGYYSEAAVTVVDLENTVTVFDENTPAGVNISAKIPGAEVGVCNVKGQLVDLTFVAPGVSADIHCHEDSFYVGNIVGFAPGAPAVLVSFDGVTGEGKTNINGLVKQGKSGIGGQILVGGQFLAIDPPGTWIFELDGVEDFIMNEGEANEFTVASIIDNTAFTVSENTDGTQSIIVASGTVTVTDSQGTDIVVDGGTQGDNNAEAIVLTRNATQDLTVGSGGVITLTGGVEIPDRDGDLVPDNIDTCINVHNTDQTDTRGCGAEGLYHSFARQETRSYRESFFNNMKGSDLTEALNPQGKSTNKTVGYLREMVKRAANQSTEIKAAAVAANALLNLTGEDQIDETDGSNDTLYQVLKKVRQWRFENR